MVDTVRTLSALQTALADNTTGLISPQNVRDFLVSAFAYASPLGGSLVSPSNGTYTIDLFATEGFTINKLYTQLTSGTLTLAVQIAGTNVTDIAKIRTKMVNAGQGNAAIWLTEWGWDSSAISSTTMQAYITSALQAVRDTYTYVTICAYFQDQDSAAYPNNGLVDTNGALKPGGTTYKNFINSLP